MLKDLLRQITLENRMERQRPQLPSAKIEAEIATQVEDVHAEYLRLSQATGFYNPHVDGDIEIEKFKHFLRSKDWTVFALDTVKTYMDQLAVRDGNGYGWHWRPLREKDHINGARFGKPSQNADGRGFSKEMADSLMASSDYYAGPTTAPSTQDVWGAPRRSSERAISASAKPYDKLIPIHALRKVATIESEFSGNVSFFVCDYTTAPHIADPDPFLMAVINNGRLHEGRGRFVIDVWDEPGFGLEQQLAGSAE